MIKGPHTRILAWPARLNLAKFNSVLLSQTYEQGRGHLRTIAHLNSSWFSIKINQLIHEKVTFSDFFQQATLHDNAQLITGMICGYRIEEIENPLTQKVRFLDKLVDELAKGRKMEKILLT